MVGLTGGRVGEWTEWKSAWDRKACKNEAEGRKRRREQKRKHLRKIWQPRKGELAADERRDESKESVMGN